MLILVSIFGPICLPPLISPVCAEHAFFSLADLRKDHSDVDIETVAIAYGCGVHPSNCAACHSI